MIRQVLLLNSSEEVINIIDWKKAINLLFSGKAIAPYNYSDTYTIKTSTASFQLPSAIILNTYVKLPYKVASLTRKNIVKRDSHTCQYCDTHLEKTEATIDHVMPTSRGGKHEWKNVVACCRRCNAKKANKTPTEAGMKLRINPYAPTKKMVLYSSISNRKNEAWKRWIG